MEVRLLVRDRRALARFRVNAFNQNRGAGAVFRTIPSKILTLEQLNAPKIFGDLALRPRGLVLVTGPTGSGKSTTLAGMVNHLNETEYGHILTVEDPVEFVHESKKCLVNQREVGPHTLSFPTRCARRCAKTPTRFWSARCATWKPSAWP
jgi:twitching motility protein PilT